MGGTTQRRKQARRAHWLDLSFSSQVTGRKEEGAKKKLNEKDGGLLWGPSWCDEGTNRWYIVFTLAYLNLRQHQDGSIYCVLGDRKVP